MNYIEFTVLKAFTSEFKLRPYQSLQWNVCAAHVNNFSSNWSSVLISVTREWRCYRQIYKFFLINNIELKIRLSGAENITSHGQMAPSSYTTRKFTLCVTSPLCGPRADLWPFHGFLCKRFSLYIKVHFRSLQKR